MVNSERLTSKMKTTFKHISLFALGMVAVAVLTSARVAPAPRSAYRTLSLKSVTQVLVVDGQETHGDQGKGKGKG